ncbi:LuxR C-terminal-related transcriptional regulator [Streptomyces sp. NPDC059010]|uniref:LuxR C-terminal-related transcriptional regulator n=1 Tax=Streptomyces sp. NPDC059010 TaxID=3346695 RepID=UPI0036794D3F
MPSTGASRPAESPRVSALTYVGLNDACQDVYRLLLENPNWGIRDIAIELELSEEDVGLALDQLADKALLTPDQPHSQRRVPINPEMSLGALLAMQEAEVAQRWQGIRQAREQVLELASAYLTAGHPEPLPLVEHILGLDATRQRLAVLAEDTRTDVLSFAPGGPQPADVLESSRALDRVTLARGVQMRTVCLESIRNSRPTMEYVEWLVSEGAEVRTVPALPMRLIVADKATAVLPVRADDARQGALLVRHPGIVDVCTALFEQVWTGAAPVGKSSEVRDGDDAPSEQERELLRLLADGHADEFAARQLGVSLRTVRRMMSGLMQRMGVKSRFQAGAKAVSMGWITGSPHLSG